MFGQQHCLFLLQLSKLDLISSPSSLLLYLKYLVMFSKISSVRTNIAMKTQQRIRPVWPNLLYYKLRNVCVNPFLSVHIPYVQSEGILPQIRLLQWRAYIFRNTQCFSTKLGRNMVNALFCHKMLNTGDLWPTFKVTWSKMAAKYSLKSLFWAKKLLLLGQFFDKFDNFFFVLLLNTSSIL